MLSVQTNLLAQNANRNLKVNTGKNAKITEKLSSGYKINRAADDASGLSMSEKMRRQVRGLHQSEDNINEGVGYVQTAEGALNEVHDILQRINELSVKAANGTNTPEDREYIDQEIQQLKKEMTRIFAETTFNERKIWDYGPGEKLDYRTEPAVWFMGSSTTVIPGTGSVTNANCGVIAIAGTNYTLHASTKGIYVDWTGYDGNDYKTEMIGWDDINVNGDVYSFEMSDFFGEPTEDNLLYSQGTPVIQKEVSFKVNPISTREDIIKSINGSTMSASVGVRMSVDGNHSKNLTNATSPVYISAQTLTYPATYASHVLCEEQGLKGGYDFDASNDDFLVPSSMSGNMDVPKTDNDQYVFHFNMPGIGPVTARPTGGSYWSGDKQMDKKNIWWQYRGGYDEPGHIWNPEKYQDTILRGVTATPGSFKNAVKENSTTSLLEESKKGNTHGGGTMEVSFSLTADKAFSYGKNSSSTNVGTFTMTINVSPTTTYAGIMSDIEKALNDSTVLDFNTTNNDSATIGSLSGRASSVYIPIYPDDYVPYDDTQNFFVQAGTESGQHISIKYEFLDLEKLGMADTNTLTQESAERAINEVKAAMQIVSRQRSDFGAYQNRLEHAYNINANVEENTQSSESVIRDTDIAEMVMEHSVNNILMQAGTSMLTQANQSKQSVLELLQ